MKKRIRRLADVPALIDIKSLKEYKEAGLNTYVMTEDYVPLNSSDYVKAIKNCKKVGLDVFIRGYNSSTYFDNCVHDFNKYKAVKGFYLWDEPNAKMMEDITNLIPFMEEKYPDKFWHLNLYPSYAFTGQTLGTESDGKHTAYENYIIKYVNTVLKNVKNKKDISLDFYPIRTWPEKDNLGPSGEKFGENYICHLWINDLYTVKSFQKESGAVDFNSCIQVYDGGGSIRYVKTKADILFQLYVNMAFGATSFEFYTYSNYATERGMLDAKRKRTDAYYAVKEANKEVNFFEDKYLSFDWQGISVYAKDGARVRDFEELKGKTILPIDVENVIYSENTIIGSFIRKDGAKGYIVVNYNCPTKMLGDNVKIRFKSKGKITVYQAEQKKKYKTNELSLSLKEGEGAFIIFKG